MCTHVSACYVLAFFLFSVLYFFPVSFLKIERGIELDGRGTDQNIFYKKKSSFSKKKSLLTYNSFYA